jgi:hypothetical protein
MIHVSCISKPIAENLPTHKSKKATQTFGKEPIDQNLPEARHAQKQREPDIIFANSTKLKQTIKNYL